MIRLPPVFSFLDSNLDKLWQSPTLQPALRALKDSRVHVPFTPTITSDLASSVQQLNQSVNAFTNSPLSSAVQRTAASLASTLQGLQIVNGEDAQRQVQAHLDGLVQTLSSLQPLSSTVQNTIASARQLKGSLEAGLRDTAAQQLQGLHQLAERARTSPAPSLDFSTQLTSLVSSLRNTSGAPFLAGAIPQLRSFASALRQLSLSPLLPATTAGTPPASATNDSDADQSLLLDEFCHCSLPSNDLPETEAERLLRALSALSSQLEDIAFHAYLITLVHANAHHFSDKVQAAAERKVPILVARLRRWIDENVCTSYIDRLLETLLLLSRSGPGLEALFRDDLLDCFSLMLRQPSRYETAGSTKLVLKLLAALCAVDTRLERLFDRKVVEALCEAAGASGTHPKLALRVSQLFVKLALAYGEWSRKETLPLLQSIFLHAFDRSIGCSQHQLKACGYRLSTACNYIEFLASISSVLSIDVLPLRSTHASCLFRLLNSNLLACRQRTQQHLLELLVRFHARYEAPSSRAELHGVVVEQVRAFSERMQRARSEGASEVAYLSSINSPHSVAVPVAALRKKLQQALYDGHRDILHVPGAEKLMNDLAKLHRRIISLSSDELLRTCILPSQQDETDRKVFDPLEELIDSADKLALPSHAERVVRELMDAIAAHPLQALPSLVRRPTLFRSVLDLSTHLIPASLLRSSLQPAATPASSSPSQASTAPQDVTTSVLLAFPRDDWLALSAMGLLARVAEGDGATGHQDRLPCLEPLTKELHERCISSTVGVANTTLARALMAYAVHVTGLDTDNLPPSEHLKASVINLSKRYCIDVTQRKATLRHLLLLCDKVDIARHPLPSFLQRIGHANLNSLCFCGNATGCCPMQQQFHHLFDRGTKWDVLSQIDVLM